MYDDDNEDHGDDDEGKGGRMMRMRMRMVMLTRRKIEMFVNAQSTTKVISGRKLTMMMMTMSTMMIIITVIIIMKKNFIKAQFPWSPWSKAPRTGATRTLTWIASIDLHTYINPVSTTLCEAPLSYSRIWNRIFEGT